MSVDPKYLKEYRCPSCRKLLCKGFMNDNESVLEVKCRGCAMLVTFHGNDAEILAHRGILIRQGLIPDTDDDAETVPASSLPGAVTGPLSRDLKAGSPDILFQAGLYMTSSMAFFSWIKDQVDIFS